MKKIILILLFSLTLFANTESCKLDVYFGNGVWNNSTIAEASMLKLKQFMRTNNPIRFPIIEDGITYDFKYAHNKDVSTIDDLLETYWQLYESGQIHLGYFTLMTTALNRTDTINLGYNAYVRRIQNVIQNYNINISDMLKKYREESFGINHNVLLVAHSQGNLFGNKIHALLTDEEKIKFDMVSVATPANNVAGNSSSMAPYTTMNGDYAIIPIVGSLPSNAFGFGHTFVNSYLQGPRSVSNAINLDIKDAVAYLDYKNICPKEYDYYRFISYMCPTSQDQSLVVDIYGTNLIKNSNRIVHEEYITSDIRVSAYENPVITIGSRPSGSTGPGSITIPSATGNCPLTSDDYSAYVRSYDKNGCSAYTFADTSKEYCYSQPFASASCDVDINEYALDYVSTTTYSSMATCSTYNMDSNILNTLLQSSKYH